MKTHGVLRIKGQSKIKLRLRNKYNMNYVVPFKLTFSLIALFSNISAENSETIFPHKSLREDTSEHAKKKVKKKRKRSNTNFHVSRN